MTRVSNARADTIFAARLHSARVSRSAASWGAAGNRRTATTSFTIATNDQLLEIIMALFQRGEFNKIKLANKAIAQFEAAALV